MKKLFFLLLLLPFISQGQSERSYISKGNEFYLQLQFELAEAQYRKALVTSPRSGEAKYNLANALMQQKKYKEAIDLYEEVAAIKDSKLQASAFYNAGVSYSRQKDLPNSIEAYKSALRLNPVDKEARENLQKALSELKKQQQDEKNKKNKGGGGGMSQQEAEDKLKDLREKERELQKKMQSGGKNKGAGGGKDW